MICCYNAARNNPFKISRHPQYTPLEQVEDRAIKLVGIKMFSNTKEVDFMSEQVNQSPPADPQKLDAKKV
jgi:hypothetical protein